MQKRSEANAWIESVGSNESVESNEMYKSLINTMIYMALYLLTTTAPAPVSLPPHPADSIFMVLYKMTFKNTTVFTTVHFTFSFFTYRFHLFL